MHGVDGATETGFISVLTGNDGDNGGIMNFISRPGLHIIAFNRFHFICIHLDHSLCMYFSLQN